ncbi:M20/M25/M40 family metallo-hydrolase [Flavobacterium sp. NKUCC04_CG]|uniref:M20/M25/M40 family metallo-hydrolase n=1 Tax=Flavobacterium sp. NKUCC04_CG TaxID=2842121 RepID=UPI001C5B468E|nr:M20/M25/M40 family metallo-hydrolase [Flavobacterium sp. NKUCC04_CG]MBW3517666.1 M20/M25/M40 family metallo-hydrolase [Flavobacterium sp. NKUCC04_CG]
MFSYVTRNKSVRWLTFALFILSTSTVCAQQQDPIVDAIVKEANQNSQLEQYAFELMDVIGPRLVGTPQMKQAHDWVVDQYLKMGINARNEEYGEWRAWQRGVTQVEMTAPRLKSLEAIQLAWNPSTVDQGIEAEVIVLPFVDNSIEFQKWLPNAKGKIILISMLQPTGRSEEQWKEYATPASFAKMQDLKKSQTDSWNQRIVNTGYDIKTLPKALEDAGAVGIVSSFWTGIMGANRIFEAFTTKIPTIDMALEDYGTLYRLAEKGIKPKIKIKAISKNLGKTKTYNTIAEIKGTETPDEYVILSAHLDSWDGGTGATDNGTGIIVMMEAARILKKVLPNNKRTILIGNWGSEEQGLNGSRAFVEDHPELHDKIQAVFNQDNGTGRIVNLNGQGFLHAYDFLGKWLYDVPEDYKKDLKTTFPGSPSSGGSDHVSFVSANIPAFMLGALSWGYGNHTWHTNRDTYDKIVFDEVRNNAILIAILAYKASQEEELVPRQKINLPKSSDGKTIEWPAQKSPKRTGGLNN